MLTISLAVSALLSHAFGSPTGPVRVERYAQNGWTLELRRDRFRDRTRCRLFARNMTYQPGAVGFATRAHHGIADAWYSVDGAPAHPWRDLYPALFAAGTRMESGGLDDPTGGIVWLPEALVGYAGTIAIETETRGRRSVVRFDPAGLAGMRAAASRLGCTEDGFEA